MSLEEISRIAAICLNGLFTLVTILLVSLAANGIIKVADASDRIAIQLEQQADPFAWENL